MRLVGIAWILIGCVTLASADPLPSDVRSKVKELFETGTTHYNLSEYTPALEDFKEAYRLVRDPVFLFNIAQCHRQLGQFAEASRLYRAYRRENPDASNREEVDRLIAQMDAAVAKHQSETAPKVQENDSRGAVLTASIPVAPRPVYRKGWFWGVVGGAAAVAAGVTVGVVLGTSKKDTTQQLPDVHF
jgi:tetratricopeptide (TPR) repeat protein